MCDFIINCSGELAGVDLLSMLKMPYGRRAPEGFEFDFAWGSMAVLEDQLNANNVRLHGASVLAWIGDIVTDMSEDYTERLVERIRQFRKNPAMNLRSDAVFDQLNGAFTILLTDEEGFCIITDPRSFSAVFAARSDERLAAIGSHCDITAAVARSQDAANSHAAEFLNYGHVCFPNTVYANVTRLEPATLFSFAPAPDGSMYEKTAKYWDVPAELTSYDPDELTEELRDALEGAVKARCKGSKLAVTLSGGLDSRMILATIPANLDCTAITFCDGMNREIRTASKVARACSRSWLPLIRHAEFIGDSMEQIVRFTGCEGLFAYAHMLGFADQIRASGFDSILGGTQMDTYVKGYYASDLHKDRGIFGPGKVEKHPYDFVHGETNFWRTNFEPHVISDLQLARSTFYERYFDPARTSAAEWLSLNPIDTMFVSWRSERRLCPSRLVALDRRIVEFCFKCPAGLKLNDYIFVQAAMPLFGQVARIPTADTGTAPGLGFFANGVRRAMRKLDDSFIRAMRLDRPVQHSWHDYKSYWRQSSVLKELVHRYGERLSRFDGTLFKTPGRELLARTDIDWHISYRLLQFAVWLGIISQYGAAVLNAVRSRSRTNVAKPAAVQESQFGQLLKS
jgi:hypothetical protein